MASKQSIADNRRSSDPIPGRTRAKIAPKAIPTIRTPGISSTQAILLPIGTIPAKEIGIDTPIHRNIRRSQGRRHATIKGSPSGGNSKEGPRARSTETGRKIPAIAIDP